MDPKSCDLLKQRFSELASVINDVRTGMRQYSKHPKETIYEQYDHAKEFFVQCCDGLVQHCTEAKKLYEPAKGKEDEGKSSEAQKTILYLEAKVQKLEREITRTRNGRDKAFDRLSAIQARLLKDGHPELSDLSDENRPTNLGLEFKTLYDEEWTDAFTFLTDTRPAGTLGDEEGIQMLYKMMKRCTDLCIEVGADQRQRLVEVVTNPLSTREAASPTTAQGPDSEQVLKNGGTKTENQQEPGFTDDPYAHFESPVRAFCKTVAPAVVCKKTIKAWLPMVNANRDFPDDVMTRMTS